MIKSIKETKVWSAEGVRQMCINHGYYTNGENEAYGKMLDYVREHKEPTLDNIYTVAQDIIKHSDMDFSDLSHVMYELANEAGKTVYDIEY